VENGFTYDLRDQILCFWMKNIISEPHPVPPNLVLLKCWYFRYGVTSDTEEDSKSSKRNRTPKQCLYLITVEKSLLENPLLEVPYILHTCW